MESEQILDSLRGDKILYTGLGLLVLTGLVFTLQTGFDSIAGGEKISVTLNVDYGDDWESQRLQVSNNTTVFDALSSEYEVNYTEYSTGYFVTSIDSVSSNENYSWLYFVNGESASVAVDRLRLEDGDNVTFRYLHNNETSQYIE